MEWWGNSYQFAASSLLNVDVIASGVNATVNPNGAFSYIRKTTATSTTAVLQSYSGTPGSFIGPDTFSLPLVNFTAGNVFFHPGLSSTAAVGIRWTSTINGIVAVSGRYVKDTTTGTSNGVNVSVYKNNTTAVVPPTLINATTPVYEYNAISTSASIGTTLDFLIDNNGNSGSDHTNCTMLTIVQLS